MLALERLLAELTAEQSVSGLSAMPLGVVRVYAIAFDLKTEALKDEFGDSSYRSTPYSQIERIFTEEGFSRIQGSLYYGDMSSQSKVDPVKCVLVVQRLANELPWFANAVRDIRMLRIEENNDLMPAIPQPKLPLGL